MMPVMGLGKGENLMTERDGSVSEPFPTSRLQLAREPRPASTSIEMLILIPQINLDKVRLEP